MALLACGFLCGISLVELAATLPAPSTLALVLVAGLAGGLCCGRWGRFLALAALGFCWAWMRGQALLAEQLPPSLQGVDVQVVGAVASLPERDAERVQFDFETESTPTGVPPRIRLSWYSAAHQPRAGERWQLLVRLRPRVGFANPHGFDYEGALFRDGVGAVGYVRDAAANRQLPQRRGAYPLLRLRAAIADHIRETLSSTPAAGIIAGLGVGATAGISTEQWRVFTNTGTTHLIAISGLHVTMVAALVMIVVRALWRLPARVRPRTCLRDVAAGCGALAACLYALLAGLSVPTQRTLVMLLAAFWIIGLRRAQTATQVLALALLAVLVIDPHAVLAPGFWLSFLAVAAILLAMQSRLQQAAWWRAFLQTQAAVTIALLPVTTILFGSVSLVAPLANLVAIPLFSALLVPGTLAAIALLPVFPAGADFVLRLCAHVLEMAWPVFAWAAQLPGALVHVTSPGVFVMGLLAATCAVLIVPLPRALRVAGLVLLIALACDSGTRPRQDSFTLTLLDVGQGLAAVVRTEHHTLLFDTGPRFRSGRSAGELAVVPYLLGEGLTRLDMIVISHPDSDHAGGLRDIAGTLPVRTLRFGGRRPALRIPAVACWRGESWIWDGVRFEFLHPARGEHWNDNNGSCLLRVSARAGSALLTGDIEALAEAWIVRQDSFQSSSAIIVPHHGSRSSSTPALVAAAHARFALISAGSGNRWGFPHPAVIGRWRLAGARVLSTAGGGAVTLTFDSQRGLEAATPWRRTHGRYWNLELACAQSPAGCDE